MIKRFLHYCFIAIHRMLYFKLRLEMETSSKKLLMSKKNKIAILPYYPVDWPGGDRLCFWEKDFKSKGYEVEIFPAWSSDEIRQYFDDSKNKRILALYSLYFSLLKRRIKQFKEIKKCEVIWIQRNLIPIFPFKKPYYEKLLSKYHKNVIYDYYDADYTSNYNLVIETVKLANKVTVASHYLLDFHMKFNPNTYFLRYCIEDQNYKVKTEKTDNKQIKIGWMGSPENASYLLNIESDLKKIEESFPSVVFSFVCRFPPELDLKSVEYLSFDSDGFNYYDWLSSVDIGIVPFFGESDRVKAKISKKCIEFMACGQIVLSSPWVHSDVLVDQENGFIVNDDEWYEILKKVIIDFPESQLYGEKALLAYRNYHNKSKLINPLINFLTKYE